MNICTKSCLGKRVDCMTHHMSQGYTIQRICDRYSGKTEELSGFFLFVWFLLLLFYFYFCGGGCERRGHTQKDGEMSGIRFMMWNSRWVHENIILIKVIIISVKRNHIGSQGGLKFCSGWGWTPQNATAQPPKCCYQKHMCNTKHSVGITMKLLTSIRLIDYQLWSFALWPFPSWVWGYLNLNSWLIYLYFWQRKNPQEHVVN